MNRLSIAFLITAILFGLNATPAQAQIGRGRLLKKIRDDIFGTPEERAREEAARRKAEQKKRAEAQRQAQLQAQRRAQKNGRTPTPAKPTQSPANRPAPNQASKAQLSAQATSRASYQSALAAPREPKPNRKGFGFTLTEKDNKLIITRIDAKGNATEAGIQRGDQIVGIGGVDVDNEDSFNEIADILNPGDTIEIAFKRGGQVDDVLVAYGTSPEFDESQNEGNLDSSTSRRGDFAPPRNVPSKSGSSVLNHTNPTVREIDRLTQTVAEQRRVIEQLQSQIRSMQQQSQSRQIAPPARSGNSILQGPSLNGPGR